MCKEKDCKKRPLFNVDGETKDINCKEEK